MRGGERRDREEGCILLTCGKRIDRIERLRNDIEAIRVIRHLKAAVSWTAIEVGCSGHEERELMKCAHEMRTCLLL